MTAPLAQPSPQKRRLIEAMKAVLRSKKLSGVEKARAEKLVRTYATARLYNHIRTSNAAWAHKPQPMRRMHLLQGVQGALENLAYEAAPALMNHTGLQRANRLILQYATRSLDDLLEKGVLVESAPPPAKPGRMPAKDTYYACRMHLQGDRVSRTIAMLERIALQTLPEGDAEAHAALKARLLLAHQAQGLKSTVDATARIEGGDWSGIVVVPTELCLGHGMPVLQAAWIVASRPSGGLYLATVRASEEDATGLQPFLSFGEVQSEHPLKSLQLVVDGRLLDALAAEQQMPSITDNRDKFYQLCRVEEGLCWAEVYAERFKVTLPHLASILPNTRVQGVMLKTKLDAKGMVSDLLRDGEKSQLAGIARLFPAVLPRRRPVEWHIGRLLDPATAKAARVLRHCATVEQFNWFAPRNAQARLWRHQFARTYPLLANLATFHPELTQRIDQGVPVPAWLAERMKGKVTKALLERVCRQSWQRMGKSQPELLSDIAAQAKLDAERLSGCYFWGAEPYTVLGLLSLLPLEYTPASQAGWKGLNAALQFLSACDFGAATGRGEVLAAMKHHVTRLKADWTEVARLADAHIPDFITSVSNPLVSALSYWLPPQPTGRGQKLVNFSRRFLTAPLDFQKLAEFSADWHARSTYWSRALRAIRENHAVPEEEELLTGQPEWLPLTASDYVVPGLGRIHWLLRRDELQAETNLMHHCVWSYGSHCAVRGSHIGQVIAEDGSRSTVEFVVLKVQNPESEQEAPPAYSLTLSQNFGAYNRQPPESCAKLAETFLEAARQEKGLVDWDALEAARETRLLHHKCDISGQMQDFDVACEEQCRAVVELYRRYLPKQLRQLSPESLAELLSQRFDEEAAAEPTGEDMTARPVRRALPVMEDEFDFRQAVLMRHQAQMEFEAAMDIPF